MIIIEENYQVNKFFIKLLKHLVYIFHSFNFFPLLFLVLLLSRAFMEISISNSNSFGGPSNIIARPCMAYFRGNNRLSLIPIISPTTKNIFKSSNFPSKCSSTKDLIKPVRINGQSRFSISLSYNQHNPSPIQVYTIFFLLISQYNHSYFIFKYFF